MDWKNDRFAQAIPHEFDLHAHQLWRDAQLVAADCGAKHVFPWHFFKAWLQRVDRPPLGLTAERFQDMVNQRIRGGPPDHNPSKIPPDYALVDSFARGLSDSYRFMAVSYNVDYRWIIPNLLDGRLVIAQQVALAGLNVREYLRAVLTECGDCFPNLYGHYMYRLQLYMCKEWTVGRKGSTYLPSVRDDSLT